MFNIINLKKCLFVLCGKILKKNKNINVLKFRRIKIKCKLK